MGYRLVPLGSVPAFQHADSYVAKRAGFTRHHVWVTPYDQQERFAAGDYPNQSRGGDGLPRWTAADRDIVDRDIVIWHTLGTNHVVRLEDWPVMPVQNVGFKLEPCGFFDANPSLDVPAERGASCAHHISGANGQPDTRRDNGEKEH